MFASPGPPAPLTITPDHVLRFVRERLIEYRPVLRSAQFGDPILNLLKLADKLDVEVGTQEIAVTAAGLLLIGFLAWYFFGPKQTRRAEVRGGIQQIEITVKGGYSPDRIRVREGVPVRLVFDRQESSDCTARVVFPDFGVSRSLRAYGKTVVEFAPDRAGRFGFACGMNMLHGTLVVEPGDGAGPAAGEAATPAAVPAPDAAPPGHAGPHAYGVARGRRRAHAQGCIPARGRVRHTQRRCDLPHLCCEHRDRSGCPARR